MHMQEAYCEWQPEAPVRQRSPRFSRIRKALLDFPIHLCGERAFLVTEYFKKHDDPSEPMMIRKAKAFRHLLSNKSALVSPDELIVGNVGSHRRSAIIQPELAGVFMSEELLWIDRRKTNPFPMPWSERIRLIREVIPYWLFRNMAFRGFMKERRWRHLARYLLEQLRATYYLINEAGGIGHFLPNYEKIITIGIQGYLKEMEGKQGDFHTAARIACEGVIAYARRLGVEALRLSKTEKDARRSEELREIARVCTKVPFEPAGSFHEAVQSLWIAHMAVCLEGLNSAVSFGRIDQYLYPFYSRDRDRGLITRDRARDILLCFSAKTTEHVFLMSGRTSEYHGGFLVAQAATVGGMDCRGRDAVNDLTHLFLDVMEEARLRDPNYLARVHKSSPDDYVRRVAEVAAQGNAVPAMFNDEVTIQALVDHGCPRDEACDYGLVGCVEPTLPGKSFFSTDAALFNLPLCVLLAINGGRLPGKVSRLGAKSPDPSRFTSMDDVMEAFRVQVDHMVARFVGDIQMIEKANRDFHPTPFSSMLVEGCIESGKDVTAGGARFNSSGIQGVGVADAADSLAAIDDVVFRKCRVPLEGIVSAIARNFKGDEALRQELLHAPKFGNNDEMPDGYADRVVMIFHDALARYRSTRGGAYVPGFYSSTSHVAFGARTGALPSGRRKGEPFAASLGAVNGADRNGPTALLNSVARLDSTRSPNGYALNLRFDSAMLQGQRGTTVLAALMKGFFASGGMEMQVNVIDPDLLEDAYLNPGKHSGIVVRVAGYCAYFDDLPVSVKKEIISRTRLSV